MNLAISRSGHRAICYPAICERAIETFVDGQITRSPERQITGF
jgi:hypothetical protein